LQCQAPCIERTSLLYSALFKSNGIPQMDAIGKYAWSNKCSAESWNIADVMDTGVKHFLNKRLICKLYARKKEIVYLTVLKYRWNIMASQEDLQLCTFSFFQALSNKSSLNVYSEKGREANP